MKHHKFDKKRAVFQEDQKKKKKRGRRTLEMSQSDPDIDKDRVVCKIAKAVAQSIKNGSTLRDDGYVSNTEKKLKSGAGSTFGNNGRNQHVESRI